MLLLVELLRNMFAVAESMRNIRCITTRGHLTEASLSLPKRNTASFNAYGRVKNKQRTQICEREFVRSTWFLMAGGNSGRFLCLILIG